VHVHAVKISVSLLIFCGEFTIYINGTSSVYVCIRKSTYNNEARAHIIRGYMDIFYSEVNRHMVHNRNKSAYLYSEKRKIKNFSDSLVQANNKHVGLVHVWRVLTVRDMGVSQQSADNSRRQLIYLSANYMV